MAEEFETNTSEDGYEDVCVICRRPESKAGKMFKLPNHITVCSDCMHKTMETVSQFDYQGILNDPALMSSLYQFSHPSMGQGSNEEKKNIRQETADAEEPGTEQEEEKPDQKEDKR